MATSQVHTEGPAPTLRPRRRMPMALVTWVFVVLVLLIVVVLLVVKVARGSTTVHGPPVSLAPVGVVQAVTSIPASVYDAVGAPPLASSGAAVLSGQRALVVSGRPAVVYVGAEFCPYCAAERWALVAALGRFGTFVHLGATASARAEVFARTPTFSFDGTSYRSRYVSFDAVEEYDDSLSPVVPAGFSLLHAPGPLAWGLLRRYDTEPLVPGSGTVPFVDVDNRLVVSGTGIGFSPGVFQGKTMAQVAADLADPTRADTQDVLGEANLISAALCAATDGRPAAVCGSAGVVAGARRLGLPAR